MSLTPLVTYYPWSKLRKSEKNLYQSHSKIKGAFCALYTSAHYTRINMICHNNQILIILRKKALRGKEKKEKEKKQSAKV